MGDMPDETPAATDAVQAAAREYAALLGTRPPEAMPAGNASTDISSLPSWWEAMSLSVPKAMAAGLPMVVTTDVGDVGRWVADGATGHVVANQSDQLADVLRRMLVDSDLRQRMGRAGREGAGRQFSSRVTARAVRDVQGARR